MNKQTKLMGLCLVLMGLLVVGMTVFGLNLVDQSYSLILMSYFQDSKDVLDLLKYVVVMMGLICSVFMIASAYVIWKEGDV